jgi:hypothetical protein
MSELSGVKYTVNDVLLALVSLQIQSYFARCGDEILTTQGHCHMHIPLSTRTSLSDIWNDIVMMMVKLDFGLTPMETIVESKRVMDGAKASVAAGFMERWVIGFLSSVLSTQQLKAVSEKNFNKTSLIASNMMLPTTRGSICGNSVKDVSFFVIVGTGTYTGIKSYAGQVIFSPTLATTSPYHAPSPTSLSGPQASFCTRRCTCQPSCRE